ncbi:hypothetical protein B0H11DRAFT_271506 [Mycena galericulata]|nr:hypothetical protein B0H11DRAFT_271506 [Mycena galericulata]
MMSVDELEACIEKLSADIERQKKILKDLEHSKSLYQRQLNAVRDPVARLPLEISSEIFLQSLPSLPEPGAHCAPMLLLNVCNAWSEIALSTPALWAAIRVVFPRARGFQELLGIWLQRARSQPLSISLTSAFEGDVADIVWRHGQHIKHLELCCDEQSQDDDSENIDIDILQCWSPGPLPLLESLTIRRVMHRNYDLRYQGPQLLTLLRLAPNLIECTFDCVQPVHDLPDVPETQVLPTLRRLMFANFICIVNICSDDGILKHLTTPSLEALSLSMYDVSSDDLLSFLKRSSPPLRELIVGGSEFRDEKLARLVGCLLLVPTLTDLHLYCPSSRIMGELFADLAQFPSLLPNLCSWTIRLGWNNTISDASWEALLRALTARRTQIQIVHVMFDRVRSFLEPRADLLAGFRELVAGGMEFYIDRDS